MGINEGGIGMKGRLTKKDIENIEKALKEYEFLKNFFYKLKEKYGIDDLDYLEHIVREYDNNKKKLKALEIIKEKEVYPTFLLNCKSVEEYNHECINKITQEEYDLLKEVLLYE